MASEQLRLKGNYFAAPDYFRTDVTKGVTRTPNGVRICTLPSDFLLGFRDALIYECGGGYRPVMKNTGQRWGQQFIKRIDREMTAVYQSQFKDLPEGVIHTCLVEAFNAHGYGQLKIEKIPGDQELLVVELSDSLMPSLVAESDRGVDLLMTGMLAAIFSHLNGKHFEAIQTDCPSMGAEASRFIVGPEPRLAPLDKWLEDADPLPAYEEILGRLIPVTTNYPVDQNVITPAPVSV